MSELDQVRADEQLFAAVQAITQALIPIARAYAAAIAQFVRAFGPVVDQLPIDANPELCWRCDAVPGRDALGLCARCGKELRA